LFRQLAQLSIVLENCVILCLLFVPQSRVRWNRRSLSPGVTRVIERVRPTETVPVGEPPSPIAPPSGCRFRTRCPRADQRCSDEVPELRAVAPGQFVACHHPLI
jgi:oligopeptide/dipeptide ABC transporter ATP-binding protein